MTELGGVTISERAKRLIEALHELSSNEAKWMVAQAFLDEERLEVAGDVYDLTIRASAATPVRALAEVGATVEKADEDGGEGSVAEE